MRFRRNRWLTAAAGVAVGAVVTSGCTFHPGQAAVVNGHEISQGSVDDLVLAGCDFFKAQRASGPGAGGSPGTSVAYLRHLFTSNLISFQLVNAAAEQFHVTVSEAVIAQRNSAPAFPPGMDSESRDRLAGFFRSSTILSLQEAVIGAHLADPSVTSAADVTADLIPDGQAYVVQKFAPSQAVTVNPAYGSWSHGRLHATDGSLSAGQSTSARRWLSIRAANLDSQGSNVDSLPPSQVCG